MPVRVIVLGCSGSGKSTLAARLATKLEVPFVPTDQVYWRPGWSQASSCDVRAWLERTVAQPAWILDGNFDAHRGLLWERAQLAVWLDLPWTTTVWRVFRRNLAWWLMRTPVWGELRMTLPRLASGVRHASRSHSLKRLAYPDLLAGLPNLTVIRIRSNAQLEAWLAAFGSE